MLIPNSFDHQHKTFIPCSSWEIFIFCRNVFISLLLDVFGGGQGLTQSIMNTGYGEVFKQFKWANLML
jgi:hypothetical protein